jgi:hypothetical protein
MLYIFHAAALHMSFYWQPLHNTSFYPYMFRLNIIAVTREFLNLRYSGYSVYTAYINFEGTAVFQRRDGWLNLVDSLRYACTTA